ncbi:MAG: hypothetical protein KKE98_03975 [Nanoarchaeota archaeon]|nr:hypothetical protein [Nanoarchaeota archaeon]MBU1597575.1 hypothetical protein [Nanoarchaeota archaeon]MBU2441510.1 hypothetical protein [Nanoarchaeota archaeon]
MEELVIANPLCKKIPSDSKATETSWDFSDKVDKHLPSENFVNYTDIQ